MSEERKVAARLMGDWKTDPFTKRVLFKHAYPDCPFRTHMDSCSAAKVRGKRKEWIGLACPAKPGGKASGPPEKCPLRFDKIVIEGVEKGEEGQEEEEDSD